MTPLPPAYLVACLALARSWVGIVADPTAADGGYQRYLEIIAAGETPARAAELARMSGCALVLRGWLQLVLAQPPACLLAPYVTGRALVDVEDAAVCAGALVPTSQLEAACVVHVGAIAGAPEHMWLAVDVTPDPWGGFDAVGVEGGDRDAGGWERIHSRCRIVEARGGHWVDAVEGGPVRPIVGVYSLAALADCYGMAAAPEST